VSPVKYELSFYIPEYAFPHSHCREGLRSYIYGQNYLRGLTLSPWRKRLTATNSRPGRPQFHLLLADCVESSCLDSAHFNLNAADAANSSATKR
jgi:hypothetical protein